MFGWGVPRNRWLPGGAKEASGCSGALSKFGRHEQGNPSLTAVSRGCWGHCLSLLRNLWDLASVFGVIYSWEFIFSDLSSLGSQRTKEVLLQIWSHISGQEIWRPTVRKSGLPHTFTFPLSLLRKFSSLFSSLRRLLFLSLSPGFPVFYHWMGHDLNSRISSGIFEENLFKPMLAPGWWNLISHQISLNSFQLPY